MLLKVALLGIWLEISESYTRYMDDMPNSRKVRDPCKIFTGIMAIGHTNPYGNAILNRFGIDYAKKRVWSKLCQMDSDNDGFTNGEELGDPDCLWNFGDPDPVPKNGTITHPGICTPIDSPICKSLPICQLAQEAAKKENHTYLAIGTIFITTSWLIKIPLFTFVVLNKI